MFSYIYGMKTKAPAIHIAAVFILAFSMTCSEWTGGHEKVLPPEQFAEIYAALVVLSADTSAVSDSSDYLEAVLDSFEVSRKEFERSIEQYESRPQIWLRILEHTADSLERVIAADSVQTKKESMFHFKTDG